MPSLVGMGFHAQALGQGSDGCLRLSYGVDALELRRHAVTADA